MPTIAKKDASNVGSITAEDYKILSDEIIAIETFLGTNSKKASDTDTTNILNNVLDSSNIIPVTNMLVDQINTFTTSGISTSSGSVHSGQRIIFPETSSATFLTKAPEPKDKAIKVSSTIGFPDSGIITILNDFDTNQQITPIEWIKYSGKTSTEFLNCERGYLGTTIGSHNGAISTNAQVSIPATPPSTIPAPSTTMETDTTDIPFKLDCISTIRRYFTGSMGYYEALVTTLIFPSKNPSENFYLVNEATAKTLIFRDQVHNLSTIELHYLNGNGAAFSTPPYALTFIVNLSASCTTLPCVLTDEQKIGLGLSSYTYPIIYMQNNASFDVVAYIGAASVGTVGGVWTSTLATGLTKSNSLFFSDNNGTRFTTNITFSQWPRVASLAVPTPTNQAGVVASTQSISQYNQLDQAIVLPLGYRILNRRYPTWRYKKVLSFKEFKLTGTFVEMTRNIRLNPEEFDLTPRGLGDSYTAITGAATTLGILATRADGKQILLSTDPAYQVLHQLTWAEAKNFVTVLETSDMITVLKNPGDWTVGVKPFIPVFDGQVSVEYSISSLTINPIA